MLPSYLASSPEFLIERINSTETSQRGGKHRANLLARLARSYAAISRFLVILREIENASVECCIVDVTLSVADLV